MTLAVTMMMLLERSHHTTAATGATTRLPDVDNVTVATATAADASHSSAASKPQNCLEAESPAQVSFTAALSALYNLRLRSIAEDAKVCDMLCSLL